MYQFMQLHNVPTSKWFHTLTMRLLYLHATLCISLEMQEQAVDRDKVQ